VSVLDNFRKWPLIMTGRSPQVGLHSHKAPSSEQCVGRGGGLRLSGYFLCNKQDGRSGPRAAGCHASRYSFVLSRGNEAAPHENLNFM
jgi:hypothetical protein